MDRIFNLYIFWDPAREIFPWNLPLLGRPILWYGFFFALGFLLAFFMFQKLLKRFLKPYQVEKRAVFKISEQLSFYVILGTIFGARLGEILFYQRPIDYLYNPLGLFKFWEGGLSSHGGVMGILLALWVFYLRTKKETPMLSWVALLDLLSIPALLAGGFIRVGNFFNQEILGKATTFPWAIIFGHPASGGPVIARHPTQLYEALFYFAFFCILWTLRTRVPKMRLLGRTSGVFFMFTFTFRFFVEFTKEPQSLLLSSGAFLNMGQILSIPMVGLGFLLFFAKPSSLPPPSQKRPLS